MLEYKVEMSERKELFLIDYEMHDEDECTIFAVDQETNQISYEPLTDLKVDAALACFSALSLGRRVHGTYAHDAAGHVSGDVDFVTPVQSDKVETF